MKQILSAVAAVALIGVSQGALAASGNGSKSGTGQSGTTGQQGTTQQQPRDPTAQQGQMPPGQTMEQPQMLTGTVLRAESNRVTIEYQGAAIPFEVQRNTAFQGVSSVRELREGQQVRASFEMKNMKNQLRSLEVMPQGQTPQQQQQPGRGGTGTMDPQQNPMNGSSQQRDSTTGY